MNWINRVRAACFARLARLVPRLERSLHIPYFGAVAYHYGVFDWVGGSASALLGVSLWNLLFEDEEES